MTMTMTMNSLRLAVALAALSAVAAAAPDPPAAAAPSAAEIVARAPADAWRPIDPANLLLVDLTGGRRVTIELSGDFAPVHVANIRALARAGWWDGTSVNRVQDNYVAQWGDATGKKPLPAGIAAPKDDPEYDQPAVAGPALRPLGYRDAYAVIVGHRDGWPMAGDGTRLWPVHCYGMVGVGRDNPPDSGSGAELYAVIGQPPRHLDRNIALVGRVIDGIDALSSLPRGTEALGFYAKPGERVPIVRARLAADLPAAERPRFEVMRSEAPAFAAYVQARANRGEGFFVRPAGGVDICNAPVPVRRAGQA